MLRHCRCAAKCVFKPKQHFPRNANGLILSRTMNYFLFANVLTLLSNRWVTHCECFIIYGFSNEPYLALNDKRCAYQSCLPPFQLFGFATIGVCSQAFLKMFAAFWGSAKRVTMILSLIHFIVSPQWIAPADTVDAAYCIRHLGRSWITVMDRHHQKKIKSFIIFHVTD